MKSGSLLRETNYYFWFIPIQNRYWLPSGIWASRPNHAGDEAHPFPTCVQANVPRPHALPLSPCCAQSSCAGKLKQCFYNQTLVAWFGAKQKNSFWAKQVAVPIEKTRRAFGHVAALEILTSSGSTSSASRCATQSKHFRHIDKVYFRACALQKKSSISSILMGFSPVLCFRLTVLKWRWFTLVEVLSEGRFVLFFAKESFGTVLGYKSKVYHIMQQKQRYTLIINDSTRSDQ